MGRHMHILESEFDSFSILSMVAFKRLLRLGQRMLLEAPPEARFLPPQMAVVNKDPRKTVPRTMHLVPWPRPLRPPVPGDTGRERLQQGLPTLTPQ